jgi:hypothetical protein
MNNNSFKENQNEFKEISGEEKDRILQNFETFKSYLGDQVHKAQKLGLSEEMIANGAQKIGNYLSKKEEPRNSEEKLLQEMWKVSDDEQKHLLSHILVNLVKKAN